MRIIIQKENIDIIKSDKNNCIIDFVNKLDSKYIKFICDEIKSILKNFKK